MSANVGEGAKKLGEKLLAEVEIEDLSSVRDIDIAGFEARLLTCE